jgi:hypothetical protein
MSALDSAGGGEGQEPTRSVVEVQVERPSSSHQAGKSIWYVELLFAYRRKIAKEQGAPLTLQGPGAAGPAASQAAGRPEVEGCRLNFISLTCRSRMRSSAFGRDVLFAVRP